MRVGIILGIVLGIPTALLATVQLRKEWVPPILATQAPLAQVPPSTPQAQPTPNPQLQTGSTRKAPKKKPPVDDADVPLLDRLFGQWKSSNAAPAKPQLDPTTRY